MGVCVCIYIYLYIYICFLAAFRDPAIARALKQEHIDFYMTLNIKRSPNDAKNAFGSANPDKKRKQAVSPSLTPSCC